MTAFKCAYCGRQLPISCDLDTFKVGQFLDVDELHLGPDNESARLVCSKVCPDCDLKTVVVLDFSLLNSQAMTEEEWAEVDE